MLYETLYEQFEHLTINTEEDLSFITIQQIFLCNVIFYKIVINYKQGWHILGTNDCNEILFRIKLKKKFTTQTCHKNQLCGQLYILTDKLLTAE